MAHDTGSVERDWPPDPAAWPESAVVAEPAADQPSRTVHLATDRGPLTLRVP
ncbi:MAG: hypothetical protein AVDCRST_MAG54-625, partial [uncultured Actinomycetospora sp.]